jgi:hypothetical protein
MNNHGRKKLVLARQTVRALNGEQLGAAHGAYRATVVSDCRACPGPILLSFVWSGCPSCIQICFSQNYTACCLSPPTDCDCYAP